MPDDPRDVATRPHPVTARQPERSFDLGDTRYEILDVLGRGGIGEVFLARDLQLDREVALKRLTSLRPEAAEQLRREAIHQAHVDHPNVCKVYGYGIHEGHPYIALQYVAGGTLASRYPEMALSARIKLMARVARAVDAAHQIGLVHRDLKPTNILCEPGAAAGDWIPLVADFGVARVVDQPTTQSGTTVGTPAYMAPEQAEGKRIDHCVDVYALGATLFELVCGRPVFEGETIKVLREVVDGEPPSPRTVDPTIARDLESIILRCLEKQPERRYPSARALAEDLERYLHGEAVVARPQTVVYRVTKWARRRRGYVALALAGLLGTGVALGAAVRARLAAAERSRLAQRFGQELQRVRNELDRAHLLPPHDVSGDRRRLAADLGELRALLVGAPEEAKGPGRVVLAHALLLVGDPIEAQRVVDNAQRLGDASTELSLAKGEILLALYRREVVELDGLGRDLRKARGEELRKTYLEPAAASLHKGAPTDAPLVEAELAVAEGREDDALAAARAALAADPFLARAHVLAGNVHRDRALARLGTGACDEAQAVLDQALSEFRAAKEIARSLPDAHVGLCSGAALVGRVATCRQADPTPALDAAAAICSAGEAVDPTREELVQYPAWGVQDAAALLLRSGKDPAALITTLIATSERARRRFPDAWWPVAIEAAAFKLRADADLHAGKDPRPAIERSLAAYAQVNRSTPRIANLTNEAGVHRTLGTYLGEIGEDPTGAYERGLVAARRAAELGPNNFLPLFLIGNLSVARANWELERGADPRASYEQGAEAYRRLVELRPNDAQVYNGIGIVAWGRGVYLSGADGDPSGAYDEAIAAYRKAVELEPNGMLPPYNLAEALRYQAWHRVLSGGDPTPLVDEARRTLDALRARAPANLQNVEEEVVALELVAARVPGADARARLAAALALLDGLPPNPRRMALRALAVAYGTRLGDPPRQTDVLAAWAKAHPGHEADLITALLAFAAADTEANRAAVTAASRKSVFLRNEASGLFR